MDENKILKIDEIIEKLNSNSNSNSVNIFPKKLNFEHLNDSITAKKRRYSDIKQSDNLENHYSIGTTGITASSSSITNKNDNENNDEIGVKNGNTSVDSLNNSTLNSSSFIASPWEARRLKVDLLEAKSLIVKLKQEIEQQHNLKAYTEELYNNKVDSLIKQCEFSSNKIIDMEKHLITIRKREKETKTELIQIKNQLVQQKQLYEEKIYNLQKQHNEFEENAKTIQNHLKNDLNELKRQNERLRMEYDLNCQELDNIKLLQKDYKDKSILYDKIKIDYELEKQEHDKTKKQLKQLEHELLSYGEWKELTKSAQARLLNLSDLEKEVQRLRSDNKNLRDSMGNKLLLEEQVYDLKQRLEKYDKSSTDLAQLKVHIKNLEQELFEWKKVAEDHLTKNSSSSTSSSGGTGTGTGGGLIVTPQQLRNKIEQLLQKDIILTSEKNLTQSERELFQKKIYDIQKNNELLLKQINEQTISIKRQKNITLRVQKKLMIVIKERNFYKQLIENFEKDLTITGATLDAINPPDQQLKARLDILEKSLAGYKDICTNLEKELESINLLPDIQLEISGLDNHDNYERLRREIEQLRLDNERLRRRKEELELEMEQRCLKGDFNIERYKILHIQNNPSDQAYEKHQNDYEKLQAECERLKRKIRRLEDERDEMLHQQQQQQQQQNQQSNNTPTFGNGSNNDSTTNDTTTMTTITNNMTLNIKEMNQLRSKLESMEAKMQHMKDIYKQASLEFREVCYMLFGYRVDRIGNANYRISSMYAENENEYLNFRLNESGILDMLETDYSVSLGDMVRQHLNAHKSLPAFLSTLTLELFNKTTIIV